MSQNHICYLCLGSNVPNRLRRLDGALEALRSLGEILETSEVIESADISGRGAHYFNVVARMSTVYILEQLESRISEIETMLGRRPESKKSGVMPIDIDIVIYDQEIVSQRDYERPYFTVLYQHMLHFGQ